MLRNVEWYFLTDVSGKPFGSIFKIQTEILTPEDGTDNSARNVGVEVPFYAA